MTSSQNRLRTFCLRSRPRIGSFQLQDYQIRDAYQNFIPLAKEVYDCVVCEDFKGLRGALQVVDHADLFRRPVSSILEMMAEVCESLFGVDEARARHYRQARQGLRVQLTDFFKLRRRPKG